MEAHEFHVPATCGTTLIACDGFIVEQQGSRHLQAIFDCVSRWGSYHARAVTEWEYLQLLLRFFVELSMFSEEYNYSSTYIKSFFDVFFTPFFRKNFNYNKFLILFKILRNLLLMFCWAILYIFASSFCVRHSLTM